MRLAILGLLLLPLSAQYTPPMGLPACTALVTTLCVPQADGSGNVTVGNILLRPGSGVNYIQTNGTTGGVNYAIFSQPVYNSPTASPVAVWGNLNSGGDLSGGAWSLQGVNGAAVLSGALTTAPHASLHVIGLEGDANIASTGQTLPSARGVFGSVNLQSPGTTNVTEATSIYGGTVTNTGGGTVTNAYGGIFENQTVGTGENYSAWFKGAIKIGSPIYFGGSTSSFARIRPAGTILNFELADGSAMSPINISYVTLNRSGGVKDFPDLAGVSGGGTVIGDTLSSPASQIILASTGISIYAPQTDMNGKFREVPTSTDPLCTAAGDLGKMWVDNTSATTTHFKVCANVASNPAWVTVF